MKKRLLFFNIILGVGFINIYNTLQAVPPAPKLPPPPAPILPPPSAPKLTVAPAPIIKPAPTVVKTPTVQTAKTAPVPTILNTSPTAKALTPNTVATKKVTLVKYDVAYMTITNSSNQTASITSITIELSSSNTNKKVIIPLQSPLIIMPKKKANLDNLSINVPSNSNYTTSGITSLVINGSSVTVPTEEIFIDIYIDNINGIWQVVKQPEDKPKTKTSSKKISATKSTAAAAHNNQNKLSKQAKKPNPSITKK